MVKEFSDQTGLPDENLQMPDDPNRRYAEPGRGRIWSKPSTAKKAAHPSDNLGKMPMAAGMC